MQFVDFEEAFTEGDSEAEAALNAAEVLPLVIEQRMEDGSEIPLPSARKEMLFLKSYSHGGRRNAELFRQRNYWLTIYSAGSSYQFFLK